MFHNMYMYIKWSAAVWGGIRYWHRSERTWYHYRFHPWLGWKLIIRFTQTIIGWFSKPYIILIIYILMSFEYVVHCTCLKPKNKLFRFIKLATVSVFVKSDRSVLFLNILEVAELNFWLFRQTEEVPLVAASSSLFEF